MATYEISPDWGETDDIKQLLAEQVALGLQVSMGPPVGPFWDRRLVFTGAQPDLDVWHAVYSEWKWDRRMINLV